MKNKRTLIVAFAILGWLTSGMLLLRSQGINANDPSAIDYCKKIFGQSCDEALISSPSWQLNLPLVGFGLVFFGLLGFLLLIRRPFFDMMAAVLSSLGIGASLVLSVYLFNNNLSCYLCLIIHALNLSIFVLTWSIIQTEDETFSKSTKTKKGVLSLISLLVLALTTGGLGEAYIIKNGIGSSKSMMVDKIKKEHYNAPRLDVPIGNFPLWPCHEKATVELVIFSSYQCPACQGFDNSLAGIKKMFGDDICISYRNFPLSSSCNPALSMDMQPQSCNASLAAIAASFQNKFLAYHSLLFQSDLIADSLSLVSIAKSINLDIDQWKSDMHSVATFDLLKEDISLANQIGISATPTVFLNGRKVENNTTALIYLIKKELELKT